MIKWIELADNWESVKAAARSTIGKDGHGEYPSDKWKKQILLAEHSPIRRLRVRWKWIDLPYWVSVHLVRHKFGIEHWVSTQRTDRTGTGAVQRRKMRLSHTNVKRTHRRLSISAARDCVCKLHRKRARRGRKSRTKLRKMILS